MPGSSRMSRLPLLLLHVRSSGSDQESAGQDSFPQEPETRFPRNQRLVSLPPRDSFLPAAPRTRRRVPPHDQPIRGGPGQVLLALMPSSSPSRRNLCSCRCLLSCDLWRSRLGGGACREQLGVAQTSCLTMGLSSYQDKNGEWPWPRPHAAADAFLLHSLLCSFLPSFPESFPPSALTHSVRVCVCV